MDQIRIGPAAQTANGAAAAPDATAEGGPPRILYCHCAYAKAVPEDVKRDVLAKLAESGVAFDAVADLCEMSAHDDPALRRIAASSDMKIAACYPRAVRWLFHAANAELDESRTEVLNMREMTADAVVERLLSTDPPPEAETAEAATDDEEARP